MSKIYLAARYSRKLELRGYAEELRERGHTIVSRWIQQPLNLSPFELVAPAVRIDAASNDVADIKAADIVIVFTTSYDDPNRSRGGYDVEFGLAYLSVPVYIVGPRVNVFHYLVPCWENWTSFLASGVL